MASITSAFVKVEPNYTEPDLILQIAQPSGYINLMAEKRVRSMLEPGDLAVYFKRLNIRASTMASQSSFTMTAAAFLNASIMSTATYHISNRAIWSRSEMEASGRWGFSIVDALGKAQDQAHYQTARNAGLYGMIPSNGEGLLNAPNAVNVTLPPDSNGNTTLTAYDNGEMAQFLLQTIVNMLVSMYQAGMPQRIEILAPQRVVLYMQQVAIVQLVQFQRSGAGSATTAGMVQNIQEAAGNKIGWQVDDTLIGKGAGGADAMLITIPELDVPHGNVFDQDIFASLTPNMRGNVLQYSDMDAPRSIMSPVPYGMFEQIKEWRLSCGYLSRPQALTIVNIPY